MTQQELAEAVGYKQYDISRIEHGTVELTEDDIPRFANALGFLPSFFLRDFDRHRVPITLYRAKNMSQTDAKALIAQHHIQSMTLGGLLLAVKPVEKRFRQVDLEDYRGSVEAASRDLRIHWGVPDGPVEDVTSLIEAAGILIMPTYFESEQIAGMSVYLDETQPVIFVSDSLPADRYRWTLCHELAHVLFHLHLFLPGTVRDFDDEADRFAAAFLMPAKDIRHQLAKPVTLEKLGHLKRRWKVAMSALAWRAMDLGQISRVTRDNLFRRMNMLGMMRDEPNKFPREEPQRFKLLVEFHLDELRYSIEDLQEVVGMPVDTIRHYYPGVLKAPALRLVK
jgi:Zn-dependent peptidase ImmA (M78 family)/plasmid maintenance system antidote protein VapI